MKGGFLSGLDEALGSALADVDSAAPERPRVPGLTRPRLAPLAGAEKGKAARLLFETAIDELDKYLEGPESEARRRSANSFIERLLVMFAGPGALINATRPGSWYLAFPNLSTREAEIKTLAIAEEICAALQVELDIPRALNHRVESLEADDAGGIARREVKILPGDPDFADFNEWCGRFRERVAEDDGAGLNGRPRRGQRVGAQQGSQPSAAEGFTAKDIARREEEEFAAASEVSGVYWPVWNVSTEMLVGGLIEPRIDFSDSLAESYGVSRRAWRVVRGLAAIDRALARQSVNAIGASKKAEEKGLLILPIHYAEINNSILFDELRRELLRLDVAQRGQLVIEVVGLPLDCEPGRLAWQVEALRDMGRGVLVSVPLDQLASRLVREVLHLNIQGVGGAISQLDAEAEERLFIIRQLAGLCAGAGRSSFIWGLDDEFEAAVAAAIGITYVSGPAIGGCGDRPSEIRSFTHSQRFARIIRTHRKLPGEAKD
jgi:hypothetical protein